MPIYKFKISDSTGKISETFIEGESRTDATTRLQRRNVVILGFLGEGSDTTKQGLFNFSTFDPVDFTDRLVPLLEAKIPLERALQIVAEASENENEKEIIIGLRRGLHEGRKLSQLIKDRGKVFPSIYASVLEAGEEAGHLSIVMSELKNFLNEAREMKSFLVAASIYPLIVVFVSICVVTLILAFIVPKFAGIFESTGQAIPPATQLLLNISSLITSYWWLSIPVLIFIIIVINGRKADGKVREIWDAYILKVPIIGKIVHLSNLSRMIRTMSILMKSGVHLLDTVTISAKVIQNKTLKESISFLSTELRRGEKLSKALSASKYIPTFVTKMLAVGEETGEVAEMLQRVADRYDSDVKKMLKQAISLFEPLIILLLGIFVAGIMLTMFMAIMDMQGGV